MRSRGGLVLALSTLLLGSAVVAGLFVFAPTAGAEGSDTFDKSLAEGGQENVELAGQSLVEEVPRDFFVPYPMGDDGVPYEELDEEEQQAINTATLWAETKNGYQVHAEYSGLARARGKEARETRAAQLAGTQGFEELGVE